MGKRTLFYLMFLSLTVLTHPSFAQQKQDTTFTFRFVPRDDMFYVPFGDNGRELAKLLECVKRNKADILDDGLPIHVDGYCNSPGSVKENLGIAAIRSNRVKSELIIRSGLNESCFITRNHADGGNFVTVSLTVPAAATTECSTGNAEKADAEYQEEECPATEAPCETDGTAEEPSSPQIEGPDDVACIQPKPHYHLALRTNLLRWATLTPDLGVEWRINRHVGILVNGSYTSWSWKSGDRRYSLWEVSPEVRWYLGHKKNGYVGAMYKAGSFNYKLSDTGKQGDLMGGGITGGYLLKLCDALSLDFTLGMGYIRTDYDKYSIIDGMRLRDEKCTKDWWGPTNAGVTLVWTLF